MALLAVGVGAMQSAAQVPPEPPEPQPYEYLDNVEGDFVNQNAPAIRPMVLTTDQGHLYAVNVHASRVLHFQGGSSQPTQVFHTPRSPVSIALWTDPNGGGFEGRLVVVCRDSYALVVMDRASGDIVALKELRDPATGRILGEPSDLLVDVNTNKAFVSCAAADAVAEVDLVTKTVTRVFRLPAKNPVFLAFDENKDVLVAPLLSGNNSGARHKRRATAAPDDFAHYGPTVVDFAAKALNNSALPDVDLFRIVRSIGAVQPVTTAMGTIQFACGVNPLTKKVWQLNTEANNKDSARQTEESIRGDFVRNRVTIADLPAVNQPKTTGTAIDLDLITGLYNPARSVGQPYGLWFASSGYAFVTGLLTDNVMLLSPTGAYVDEFDLTPGAIPRAAIYSEAANVVYVYCWGNNTIEARVVTAGWPTAFTLQLGLDPTPADVRAGRAIFYDASHSMRNNMSCASCHVEGRTDLITWNLSSPRDDKGPMTTQTLDAINRLGPLHWRGEQLRGLVDFNPAFTNLLGAPAVLDDTQFGLFERFVMTLETTPNTQQNEQRLLDDNIQARRIPSMPAGSAIAGQGTFKTRCEACHSFPLGTKADNVADGALRNEQHPRRQFFRIGSFIERWRIEQDGDAATDSLDSFLVTLPSLAPPFSPESLEYPLLGSGPTHAGLALSMSDFNLIFVGGVADVQPISDVTAFLAQWDQGVAPSTYRTVLLNQANQAAAATTLTGYFVPQAQARHCDLVLFGKVLVGGSMVDTRWWFDRTIAPNGAFVPDSSVNANQPATFFTTLAAAGQASVTCVGLPVGMGRGFGIDFDRDGRVNRDELQITPKTLIDVADTDGDGWPDGHEVANGGNPVNAAIPSNDVTPPSIVSPVTQFVSARVARINVETDEPCVISVTYQDSLGNVSTRTTTLFARTHTLLLDNLQPSTGGTPWMTYTGGIVARDHAGLASVTSPLPTMPAYNLGLTGSPPPPITTRNFSDEVPKVVASGLAFTSVQRNQATNTLTATATVRVEQKLGGPPAIPLNGRHVVARVFKNDVLQTGWSAGGTSSREDVLLFGPSATPYLRLASPFLVSALSGPPLAAGTTTLTFSLSGLNTGDEVTLNLELIGEEDPASGAPLSDLSTWNMPSTTAANRAVSVKF